MCTVLKKNSTLFSFFLFYLFLSEYFLLLFDYSIINIIHYSSPFFSLDLF